MAKILLIDDDSALTTIFSTAFTKAGFQTVVASSGQDGIDKAKNEKPDIILLDQIMPGMSGNQTLKALKSDPLTQNMPVIMLSNFNQEELVKEAINSGAADYVSKFQVEPQDIVNKIKQILKM